VRKGRIPKQEEETPVEATLQEKRRIMDAQDMQRALTRIAHEIIERNHDLQTVALAGIRRRGVPLARTLAEIIRNVEGVEVPTGVLDITFYRDDLSLLAEHPLVNGTDIPFYVTGRTLVMVDDVLYTGRTARAAMEALVRLGRPGRVQLAALIDRGHRELPIRADYVGKNLPTSRGEVVGVHVQSIDGREDVTLYDSK
jgi:pyrimidine operon attenuation protein/uracil phosphoribosyltransferase